MKIKFIIYLLLTALIFTFAVSCSNANKPDEDKNETENNGVLESSDAPGGLKPDLPEGADFGGENFTILITGNIENNWKKNDFRAEEITGEVLNDARYDRNAAVEEALNVKIKTIEEYGSAKGEGSGYKLISKSVLASDAAYDAGMINVYDLSNLARGGFLYDINSLPYLDLKKPWWDQKANSDMMIQNKMFFTTGDISTADNDATYAVLFNKQLVTDYKLKDPYGYAADGTWTFDKLIGMGTPAVSDVNGDGVYDKNDSFAAIVWDDAIMGAVNGSLEKCGFVNKEGKIELSLFSEKTVDILKKYTDFVFDKEVCYQYQRVSYDITDALSMFSTGRAMFFMQMLDLTSYFRDMQTDYGILPYPKYNENQKEYGHTIGSWHSMFLCAPASVGSAADKCGAVLETLAYESYKTVTPAYYNKTLIGKYFRDEESAEMLNIILSTRVYDVGWYYQLGKLNDEILFMVYENDPNFASRYAKNESKALADAERINAVFAQNVF